VALKRRSFIHENPTSLASFGKQKVLLFSSGKWGDVCYLFHEKIHFQQKIELSWVIVHPFFQKTEFVKFGHFTVF
jgi:hypothetical protein